LSINTNEKQSIDKYQGYDERKKISKYHSEKEGQGREICRKYKENKHKKCQKRVKLHQITYTRTGSTGSRKY
jgi:hypothetical protein